MIVKRQSAPKEAGKLVHEPQSKYEKTGDWQLVVSENRANCPPLTNYPSPVTRRRFQIPSAFNCFSG